MTTRGLDAGLAGWRAHHDAMRETARLIAQQRADDAAKAASTIMPTKTSKVPFNDPRDAEDGRNANGAA